MGNGMTWSVFSWANSASRNRPDLQQPESDHASVRALRRMWTRTDEWAAASPLNVTKPAHTTSGLFGVTSKPGATAVRRIARQKPFRISDEAPQLRGSIPSSAMAKASRTSGLWGY